MASGHKYRRLDSLRGLAALSVGVGHALLCVQLAQGSALQTVVSGVFDGDYALSRAAEQCVLLLLGPEAAERARYPSRQSNVV